MSLIVLYLDHKQTAALLALSCIFLLFKIAILRNCLAIVGSFGGVTKSLLIPAEYLGKCVLFLSDLMAFFKTCFKTVVCMFGLGLRMSCTFFEVDNTL